MARPRSNRRGATGLRSAGIALCLVAIAALFFTVFAGSAAATDGEAGLTLTDNSTGAETAHEWETTIGQSPTNEPRPVEQVTLDYGSGAVDAGGVGSEDVTVSIAGDEISVGTVGVQGNAVTVDIDSNVTATQGETLAVSLDGITNPTTAGTYNATLSVSGGDVAYDPAETVYSIGSGGEDVDLSIDQNASTLDVQEGDQVDVVVDVNPLNPLGLLDLELLTDGELRATESVELNLLDPMSVTLSFEATPEDDGATITVNAGGDLVTTTLSVDTDPLFDISIDEIDDTVTTEENLTVSYAVENLGDLPGAQDLTMLVDGQQVAIEEALQLDGGLAQTGSFTYSPEQSDIPTLDVVLQTLDSTVNRTVEVVEPSLFDVSIDEGASTLNVTEGEQVEVVANVSNLGGIVDTQNLSMLVGGTVLNTTSVRVADGSAETVTLSFEATAAHDGSAISLQTLDDVANATISVDVPPLFDVSIDEEESTLNVTEGEQVEVVANVSNLGGIVDTQNLSVLVDGTVLNTTSVQVADGSAETVTLSFEATAAHDGSAISLQTLDDVATATISVDLPPLFEVDIDEEASTLNVTEGEAVEIVANVTNVGGLLDTQNLSVGLGGTETNTTALQLAGGTSQTVNFTFEPDVADDGAVLSLATLDDLATTTISVDLPSLFEVSIDESASTLHVTEGEQVEMVANVTNVGGLPGTQNLSLLVGGAVTNSESVELGSGVSQTVSFTLEGTAARDGTVLSLETLDDVATASITVDSPGLLDIGLNGSASQLDVEPGETAEVTLDYENVGDLPLAEEISLFVGGDERTAEIVEAGGGASGQVTLSFVAQSSDDGAALTASSAQDFVTATLSVEEEDEEPDPEPEGTVAFDGSVVATQTQFGVDVTFEDTLGEDAFLVVTNQRTEGVSTQDVTEQGSVQIATSALGGLAAGDNLTLSLYETNDRVTLLDEVTGTVQSPPVPELLAPATLELGAVDVGSTTEATVELQNTGTAPLSISDVSVDSGVFAVSGIPAVVEPGTQAPVTVTFAPVAPRSFEGNLTILSNASAEPSTVSLTGVGQEVPEPAGELSLSAGELSFGSVGIGDATTAELTVSNTGDGPLTLDPLTVGGPDAGAFTVQTDPFGSGTGPAELAPGESTAVDLTFTPSAPSQHSGSLVVESSETTETVSLQGQGLEPTVSLDPEPVDFGEQTVGASVTETIALTAGATAVDVDSLAIGGDDATAFTLGDAPETIPADETVLVDLTYSPDATGTHSATLELTDATGSIDLSAALNGSAVTSPPSLQVEPTSVRFANLTVGETVAETVTITNDGGSPLTVSRAELGAGAAFEATVGEIASADEPVTLAPGDSRDVTVEVSPDTPGTHQTYLYVQSDAPERPNRVVAVTSGAVQSSATVDEQNRQRIEALIENASAGEEIALEFPEPLDEGAYETDNVTVRPGVSGDLEVNVTSSDQMLSTTPNTTAGFANNTTMVGNVSATTNLPNSQIEEVTFEATIDRARLEAWGTDAGNVSFYRFDEEELVWKKHETEVLREGETEVVLLVRADGFSEWTAAAARPEFTISDTNIDVNTETTPEEATIQVYVSNTGGTDGRYVADLLLNGDEVDSQGAIISDGGLELFQFERMLDEPGTYEIRVNDVYVANVDVSNDSAEVSDPDSREADDAGEENQSDVSLSFALPAVALALVLAAALGVWGYRRRNT